MAEKKKSTPKDSAKAGSAKKSSTEKRAAKSRTLAKKAAVKTQVKMTRSKTRAAKGTQKKESSGSRWKEKSIGHAPHSARITEARGPVKPVASRTLFIEKNSPDRKWLLLDAEGQTVGRLASEIARLLRGKHKATFTPNNDAGDFVVVVNAEKVVFTAAKEEQKEYFHHSGYIGGLKVHTPRKLRETYPERILWNAVKGMVPRTPLGRDQMRKLNIYAGTRHPHAAQHPVVWKLPAPPVRE